MKPYNVTLWVYADDESEVAALQDTLNDFVTEKYNQHIYPRAKTIQGIIDKFGNSAIVNAYLKQ